MRASPAKRRERDGLIRRFRPGTAENERLATPQRGERNRALASDAGAVSAQSPANKYPQLLSPRKEKTGQPSARTAWEMRARSGKGRRAMAQFPRQPERLTLVTGAVDYKSLLQDQTEQRRSLAEHDRKYGEMMIRFDEINYLNQRKLSKLLKGIDEGFFGKD